MLNFRQEQCYNHTFHIYRRGFTEAPTTGTRTEGPWYRVAADVPGLLSYTSNDDRPTGAGQMKQKSPLLEDKGECEVVWDVQSGDAILDVSRDAAGQPTRLYDALHLVQGDPLRVPDQGVMELNYQTFRLMDFNELERPAEIVP